MGDTLFYLSGEKFFWGKTENKHYVLTITSTDTVPSNSLNCVFATSNCSQRIMALSRVLGPPNEISSPKIISLPRKSKWLGPPTKYFLHVHYLDAEWKTSKCKFTHHAFQLLHSFLQGWNPLYFDTTSFLPTPLSQKLANWSTPPSSKGRGRKVCSTTELVGKKLQFREKKLKNINSLL